MGTPELRKRECLWNAFVTRQQRSLPTPITMFAIDKYVLKTLIKQPAEFDSYDIPNQRKGDLLYLHDRFEPEIASTQSDMNDDKWDIDKKLREMGVDPLTNTEIGICLANIPTYSSFNVRIALTIFGQGTRLLFLQNEGNHSLWPFFNMMARHLFNSRDGYPQEVTRFFNDECKMRDGISITSILQRSSKPLGFKKPLFKDTYSALNPMILLKAWPAD